MSATLLWLGALLVAWGLGYMTGWRHARRGCATSCPEMETAKRQMAEAYERLVEAGLEHRHRASDGLPPLDDRLKRADGLRS